MPETRPLWDQDVKEINGASAERICAAVARARNAFWNEIAASFPEVRTGDMAPGQEVAFEWASNTVVCGWLYNNLVDPRDVVSIRSALETLTNTIDAALNEARGALNG